MSGKQLVQSLLRGLEILRHVAEAPDGLSLAQLATRLGVSRPTAFNLARTLVATGYLLKTAKPVHYTLGPAISSLYRQHCDTNQRDNITKMMQRLSSAFPAGILSLGEVRGDDILTTVLVDPAHGGLPERPLGRIVMPYAMALSLCFQAFWLPADRAHYEQRYPFSEFGRGIWGNAETFESFLGMCRSKGHVLRRVAKSVRIAAPIYGRERRLIAALALSLPGEADGPAAERRLSTALQTITKAADSLSTRAGEVPGN